MTCIFPFGSLLLIMRMLAMVRITILGFNRTRTSPQVDSFPGQRGHPREIFEKLNSRSTVLVCHIRKIESRLRQPPITINLYKEEQRCSTKATVLEANEVSVLIGIPANRLVDAPPGVRTTPIVQVVGLAVVAEDCLVFDDLAE